MGEPAAAGKASGYARHFKIARLDSKATLETDGSVVGVPGSAGGVLAETALAGSVWHGSALSFWRVFLVGRVFGLSAYKSGQPSVLLHSCSRILQKTIRAIARRGSQAHLSWN